MKDLHFAIFDAFNRDKNHWYEYQFGGKGPNDPKAVKYRTPDPLENSYDLSKSGKYTTVTTIDSLNLNADDVFGYWFDFGDDWWHQINVNSIQNRTPTGRYPNFGKGIIETRHFRILIKERERIMIKITICTLVLFILAFFAIFSQATQNEIARDDTYIAFASCFPRAFAVRSP